MIIAEEQVETMPFDYMWPTRGSRQFQSMASSLLRRKRFGKIGDDAKTGKMLGRMDPSKCYPNCPQHYFQSRCIRARQMVAVLSCTQVKKSANNVQSSGAKSKQHLK
jgi:hypothetical protein